MVSTETNILTLREVYKHFRISRATALRLIHSGKLKAAKIGRCWRISQEAVDELDREIARGLLMEQFEALAPTGEPEGDPGPGSDQGGNWE